MSHKDPIKRAEYQKEYRENHLEKTKAKSKRWREANPEKANANIKRWRELHPEIVKLYRKQYREIHSEKRKTDGKQYREVNREKESNRHKLYSSTHREQNNAKSNARRARVAGNGGRYTAAEWKDLCNRYGNKCLRCGRTDVKLTVDHVIPIKLGGVNTIENLQPLCGSCNFSKGASHRDYRSILQPSLFCAPAIIGGAGCEE